MESYTNIYNAIEIGDSESLKRSWTKSIDIDFHDKNENSFIMLAVKYQQQEIVAYLLTFNPNLYLCNNENETVFQIAEPVLECLPLLYESPPFVDAPGHQIKLTRALHPLAECEKAAEGSLDSVLVLLIVICYNLVDFFVCITILSQPSL